MRTKLYLYAIGAIALLSSSCNKFDEFNTNPDKTTKVTPAMLATGAQLSSFRSGGDGKAYIGYSALPKYVAYISEGALGAQYNQVGSGSFSSYKTLPNLAQMITYATGGDYESSYRGLALFLKAFNGYNMTMRMGDIPYSESGLAQSGNRTPKYDEQKYVFEQVLADFQRAEEYFAAGRNFQGDIMFGGDVAKWRKAANAMQLKVLMSLSKKITNEQKARFAQLVAANKLLENNDDNLKLVYTAKAGTWHPLYNQTLFNPYTTITTVVADELKKLKDRRLFYFAEPAPAKLVGGALTERDYEAYVGADPSVAFDALNVAFQQGAFSVINQRYISVQGGDPYIQLTYAEQCFIIAEAIELGWVSGTSKTYYENGVKAALKMVAAYDSQNTYSNGMPIDDTYVNGYFTGEAAYKTASADRLKQIWMQRYLLKYLQDGYDAYFEYRRTGYPVFPNDPNTSLNIDNKNGFPMRWSYPSGEAKTNKANLDAALARQFDKGYDGTNELMWLLK